MNKLYRLNTLLKEYDPNRQCDIELIQVSVYDTNNLFRDEKTLHILQHQFDMRSGYNPDTSVMTYYKFDCDWL